MLAMLDVPQDLEELDRQNRFLGASLAMPLLPHGSRHHMPKGEDLLRFPAPSVVYIEKGIYKYFSGAKLIRFYNTSNLVAAGERPKGHCLVSDFGSEVVVWSRSAFEQLIAANPDLVGKWSTYLQTENDILHSLCALVLQDEVSPNATIKGYEEGEIIITEGEMAREVFEMIEGNAAVSVQGRQVGLVKAGEVFGEISFLTSSVRTATVRAFSKCLVSIMNEHDLVRLIKYRPTMNLTISKTLAQRLIDANRKLVGDGQKTG